MKGCGGNVIKDDNELFQVGLILLIFPTHSNNLIRDTVQMGVEYGQISSWVVGCGSKGRGLGRQLGLVVVVRGQGQGVRNSSIPGTTATTTTHWEDCGKGNGLGVG